jgi:hypothetical protein
MRPTTNNVCQYKDTGAFFKTLKKALQLLKGNFEDDCLLKYAFYKTVSFKLQNRE